jgi:hypothetical protein
VIVSHPEDVSGAIEGETPGIYQVQISSIGDTRYITLKIGLGESIAVLIFAARSQITHGERHQ